MLHDIAVFVPEPDSEDCRALGIAFHELATNAVKYGAFSNKPVRS